jgi:hypothetical protein
LISIHVRRLGLALAAALLLAAGPARVHAEAAPEDIAEIIAEAAQVCRTSGGKAETTAILRSDDLNGDGRADWIADFSKLQCDGAPNPACNDSGCMLQLYYWDGEAGWDLVFEDFVKSYKFSSSGETRTMHVTTSGIPCNKPIEDTCTYIYRLEKEAVDPVQ